MTNRLSTFLWYDHDLDEVLDYYRRIFDLEVREVNRNETGAAFTASATLYGQELVLMNAPGGQPFSQAISLALSLESQAEVDRVWDALTEDGKELNCGWCEDAFGVAWQVTPAAMQEWLGNPDAEVRAYAWQQLMNMKKIVLDDLHR